MAYNKILKADGTVLMDLTNDTVDANSLLQGVTAHDRSGTQIQGAVVVAPIDDTTTASDKVWSSEKISEDMGDLSDLSTTDKSSLVNAINEVKENSIAPHLIISSESGSTVTVSNGTITLTPTETGSTGIWECNVPKFDTWTITSVKGGSTATITINVDIAKVYEVSLDLKPEGSTVLPTDDIQTWLKCGDIKDKAYTTINEVLADTTTLSALINDNNASDYLVRSTTWATSVCANSTAMAYIGANDYCADKLLSDSTWLLAICNSAYYESVLGVKVPTMTSNTTPSGVAFGSTLESANFDYYKAFNGTSIDAYDRFSAVTNDSKYIGYDFDFDVVVKHIHTKSRITVGVPEYYQGAINVQGMKQDGTWETVHTYTVNSNANGEMDIYLPNVTTPYSKWRLEATEGNGKTSGNVYILEFYNIQFYGRTQS